MRGAFAQAVVDTVREPLLVLNEDLRVVAASPSFYLKFKVSRDATQGRLLYSLGDGQWDIPKLQFASGTDRPGAERRCGLRGRAFVSPYRPPDDVIERPQGDL